MTSYGDGINNFLQRIGVFMNRVMGQDEKECGKMNSLTRERTRRLGMAYLALVAVALTTAVAGSAETGLARHKRIFAVPAPGKVVIDGNLDDWDLSGQIGMFVTSATKDVQGAKIALMYDKDAVYISGEIRDM